MPTDASGPPTTNYNIPKYNTAGDAPSGKGNGAQMDFIDNLLKTSFVPKPSGIVAYEVPVWDGTTWQRSSVAAARINNGGTAIPKITTSPLGGGPPASPSDGDIWIATGVDTTYSTRWQFQYDLAGTCWRPIGAVPVQYANGNYNTTINANTQVASSGFYYIPNAMSASFARAGTWKVTGEIQIFPNGSNNSDILVASFISNALGGGESTGFLSTNSQGTSVPFDFVIPGVAASTVFGVAVNTNALATHKIGQVQFSVTPIKIT